MRFQRDQRGFIFSLDATLAMLVVLIVMAGVARVTGGELVYGQHGYLRLERYANDTLEVLQLTGTMDIIISLVEYGANENAENMAREELRKMLPAEIQFKLMIRDNRLTVYPSDAAGWDTAFANAEEIATATRISIFEGVGDTTVALWHFDEGIDNKVYDETQNNNDGTIYGNVSWTTGKYGYALDFPGTSGNYVSVPHSESLAPSGGLPNLSVEGWAYVDGSQISTFAQKDYVWVTRGWLMKIEPASDPSMFKYTVLLYAGGQYGVAINDAAPLNTWVHLAFTYEGSSGTIKVYVNGTDRTADDSWNWRGVGGNVATGTDNLFIGWGDAGYFKGKIDEIRIENQALTAEEIATDVVSAMREFGPVTLYLWRGASVG